MECAVGNRKTVVDDLQAEVSWKGMTNGLAGGRREFGPMRLSVMTAKRRSVPAGDYQLTKKARAQKEGRKEGPSSIVPTLVAYSSISSISSYRKQMQYTLCVCLSFFPPPAIQLSLLFIICLCVCECERNRRSTCLFISQNPSSTHFRHSCSIRLSPWLSSARATLRPPLQASLTLLG